MLLGVAPPERKPDEASQQFFPSTASKALSQPSPSLTIVSPASNKTTASEMVPLTVLAKRASRSSFTSAQIGLLHTQIAMHAQLLAQNYTISLFTPESEDPGAAERTKIMKRMMDDLIEARAEAKERLRMGEGTMYEKEVLLCPKITIGPDSALVITCSIINSKPWQQIKPQQGFVYLNICRMTKAFYHL
jgi:hypothetical protein